jgi:hypothetical protein
MPFSCSASSGCSGYWCQRSRWRKFGGICVDCFPKPSRSGSAKDEAAARPHADAKDVPILAAAIGSSAALLVTHNIRHFASTDSVRVLRPSALLEEARAWIATRGQ